MMRVKRGGNRSEYKMLIICKEVITDVARKGNKKAIIRLKIMAY